MSHEERNRRRVGSIMLLVGSVAAVLGARAIIGFEPLPAVVSPDNIAAFLDFDRYFGIVPGVVGVVAGLGFVVVGLLVLLGFVSERVPADGASDRPSISD